MKTKLEKPDLIEWKRVFKIFPVNTEDGYRVMFGHVWKRKHENLMGKTEYDFHTNPDGLEDEYQRTHSNGYLYGGIVPPPPPRPSRPKPQTTLLERIGMTDEIGDWVYETPLTEGKMKCGAKMPTCKKPKKPPPPPAPPRKSGQNSIAIGHNVSVVRSEDGMSGALVMEQNNKKLKIGDKFKRTYKQTKRKL